MNSTIHGFKLMKPIYLTLLMIVSSLFLLAGCGPSQIEFAVKHLSETPGEQIAETVSFHDNPGLDNTSGEAALQLEIQFERTYRHQINELISNEGLSGQRVRDKIVELYKLPINDPEGTVKKALCPISVVIPPGKKASIVVEWTEKWAEGLINEGLEGEGDRLGTYSVFLGYTEVYLEDGIGHWEDYAGPWGMLQVIGRM
ncbi:MAG: hypothetical protein AAF639_42995, partial [Chloroflexota bacterium]